MSTSVVTVAGDWGKLLCGRCYTQAKPPKTAPAKPPKVPSAAVPATPPKRKPLASAPAAPRQQPPHVASPLPRDMVWLASLHRTVAEGGKLATVERKLLDRRDGEATTTAALRYAELLADTEARIAEHSGDNQTARKLAAVRDTLAQACQAAGLAFKDTYQRALAAADGRLPGPPESLETAVIRAVAGETFAHTLSLGLIRRGLPEHALERPSTDVWRWLDAHEDSLWKWLPVAVHRLRRLDPASFTELALTDVNGMYCDADLAHLAVAEQWVTCSTEIMSELKNAREAAETAMRNAPPTARRGLVTRSRQAGEAYARGSARCLEARLIVGGFHIRAVQIYGTRRMRQLRAGCLAEAARAVTEADRLLGALVTEACREHRTECPKPGVAAGCAECAPAVADMVRQRKSQAPAIVDVPPPPATSGPAEQARKTKARTEPVSDGQFACGDLLKNFANQRNLTLAVLECHPGPDGPAFGYGWLTREGSEGQGAGTALNDLDQVVQALCSAALRIREQAPSVRIVSRHVRAVNLVHLTLQAGAIYAPLDTPLSEVTRERLRQVAARPHGISVSIDTCERRHQGSLRAERLAQLAAQGKPHRTDERPDGLDGEVATLSPPGRLVGPDDDAEAARWLTADGARGVEVSWRVALHHVHLNNNWCPLPDGRLSETDYGRRLRLHLNHDSDDTSFKRVQRVALRRRGGRWELAGLHWPSGLAPGTLVTLTWHPARDFVTAYTTPLQQPERVDDVHFTHQYDPLVATRQNAPGADQYGRVPDLNDMSWVMHTLRKLGYLTENGEAILAEDALVENCLRLGLPARRARGIPEAIKRLLRARTLDRVTGSQDKDGHPWYPSRAGQPRIQLLRYTPRVEVVATRHGEPVDWHPHRHPYKVAGFLRRLPPGAKASPEQEEAYREAVREARIVDRGLPEGRTYVKPHERKR